MQKKLFLLSNSTNAGENYLAWTLPYIKGFFEKYSIKTVLFVPYAGVSMSYDTYADRVSGVFAEMGVKLTSIHTFNDPKQAVRDAECIVVGGGNTFHLVAELHRTGAMAVIRERAEAGVPFMGWSAGSNVACPSMKTTNDMPIIEPESFNTLNLINFQINPHYLDANPAGHGGETREDRLKEFMVINPEMYIVGLREATLLEMENGKLNLIGNRPMRIFRGNKDAYEVNAGDDLSFLL